MNTKVNEPNFQIKDNLDKRWIGNTIYNHYEHPTEFMEDVINNKHLAKDSESKDYIKQGIKAWETVAKDTTYDKKYADVARKVRDALIARGFTTKLLYGNVEFTTENTGVMSKQRALLGRRDCYYKDPKMSDGKLFHDLYINLSYSWSVADSTIENNSYALYALCAELSRLISIRVFVINHVGTSPATCYSYCLKRFRQNINPQEFLFFTSNSKRTFGWATYGMLASNSSATVGSPTGTVSIDKFNLTEEIENIWQKMVTTSAEFRKAVGA